jgi:amino acid adenylation domain-containing protein
MAQQEASLPVYCTTLVELLRLRAKQQPDDLAYRFLPSGQINGNIEEWTYRGLDLRARTIAAQLQEASAEGERALLLYPPGLEFISAFLGCLYAKVVAVPAYPPHPTRLDRTLPRLRAIAQDSGARFILTTRSLANNQTLVSQAPEMADACWIATDQPVEHIASAWRQPEITGETLTFLQYTSGSTGQPKGVINTHANLLHNERLIAQRFGSDSSIHVVGWLPLFHDMGLIGNVLHPLYLGASCTLMSPLAFLQRPMRWLEAISHFRGNISGGPNFAYDLCARKALPHELGRLDLSSWAVAYNGSEPIRKDTIDRFAATFAPCGFQPEAFYPCYGLAEATLFVTGVDRNAPPSYRTVKTEELERNLVVDAPPDDAAAKTLVSIGLTGLGQKVVIVNIDTLAPCPPQTVGEIWVSGPSVASGYWNRPEESVRTFGARLTEGDSTCFLRTGDLGFMIDGELFITGRLKDLIILRGRNLYPQDIELTLEHAHPAVRPWSSAAFSVDVDGEERLGVATEADMRGEGADPQEVIDAIRRAVAEEYGAHVYAVLLIKPRTIPKTSSGKIRRHACRKGFLEGSLETISTSVVDGLASPELEAAGSAPSLADELKSTDAEGRLLLIQQLVQRQLASSLRIQSDGVDIVASPASLGLDSLMGIVLQSRLEAAVDLSLPDAFLWQQSTIEELIKNLAVTWEAHHIGIEKADQPVAPIEPAPLEGELPLSSGQQRLLLLENLASGIPVYNIHFGLRITGALDVELLRRSLEELINRHAVLRTVFSEVNGQPCQIVRPQCLVDLVRIDLRSFSEEEREDELHKVATSIASEPFNLETGPLMRTHLVMHAEGEHVLLITQHHIITDGWSIAQLATDMAAIYKARAHKLPPPQIPHLQFADYARSERSDQTRWEPHRSYWKKKLAGLPRLDLPADRPGPPHRSYRGGRVPLRLTGEISERLSALGRKEGCTPYVTLLAGYAALLYRYTGQEDFAVGSVIANRARAELREMIGFFANTVVLRCDLSGKPSFRELLRRMQEAVAEAMLHGELPFGDMVQAVGVARDGHDNPLFQTSFIFENNPLHATDVAGVRWQPLSWAPDGSVEGTAKFDLSLVLEQTPEGFAGIFEYDSDRFEPETIRPMAGHLQTLLSGIAKSPDYPLGMLPILTPEEEHRMLVEWNSTTAEAPREICFQQLFERQVAQTPNALAATYDDHRVTYQELNNRANKLAHYLHNTGVGQDVIVAVFMRRGIDLLTSILAVFKAGGAYLPLDPDTPAQRHFQVLNQSNVSRVLTSRNLAQVLEDPAHSPPKKRRLDLFHIEDLATLDEAEDNLPVLNALGNLAYVIYTSGSTGVPKGVMVEHLGMLNHLYAKLHDLKLVSSDVVAQTASQCFDISVWQFLSALLVGGRVHIIREDVAVDPRQLFEATAEECISVLEIVPSLLRATLEDMNQRSIAEPDLRSLRWLLLTGEVLPPELARKWLERYPTTSILNAYGPTECSDDVAHYAICDTTSLDAVHTPIGHPVLNARLYILDRRMQPVPVGIPGELYVGGICVGRGYFDDPIRTAQAFVPDPFTDGTTSRLYRTGDMARYLPDGNIVFLGRLDFQVKIRGFRIELGEIQFALELLPAVSQSVVIAHQDSFGDKRLVAYLQTCQSISIEEIRDALRQRLPDYMIPSIFMILEAMPLTPNGKIDRQRLPAPPTIRDELEDSYTPPRTQVEEILAQIWAEVLGLDRVGVDDDFFSIGGHSLLATQVMARLRSWLSVDLPLRALFEAPSIAQLARHVELARRVGAAMLPPIQPISRDGHLALSFAQQRLWFLDQLAPDDRSYNVPGAVRIQGPLDVMALERSFQQIVARHEVLRTTFTTVDAEPVQIVALSTNFNLDIIDLQAVEETKREAEAQSLAEAEARRPFSLTRGPLLRATLLRLGDQHHILLLTMHHIISDGWSLGVLMREVSALYHSLSTDKPYPLPDLPIQYADFAHWQREWLAGELLNAQLDYWSHQLDSAPPALEIPTDFPRHFSRSHTGSLISLSIRPDLADRLRALNQKHQATMYMTLLAAFQVLLYRYSRQDDISVGSPIAGRTRTETEALIGFFVNTLVMRTDLSGAPSFAHLLARVKEVTLGAYSNQDVPFEKLVEVLSPQRDLNRTPFFQVMFILQNAPLPQMQLGEAKLEPFNVSSGTSKFDLTMSLEEKAGSIEGYLEYSTELFEEQTIQRMIGHFEVLIEAIADNPQASIDDLPLLTDVERKQLIVEWNKTREEYPNLCIHELFQERVDISPEAAALIYEGRIVKYSELNRQANQLAHYLRRRGIGRDSRVGIYIGRSPELVIAMLGILKAGGAYVPLDPAYPKDRLRYMIASAEISIIAAHETDQQQRESLGAGLEWVDVGGAAIAMDRDDNPDSVTDLDDAAYVVFTSGSTGTPNGVVGLHRGAVNRFSWMWQRYPFVPGEVSALKTSSNFVDSVWETFGPLLQGVPSVILPDETVKNHQAFIDALEAAQVTRIVLVPSLLRVLIESEVEPAHRLPHLRYWTSSGESLPPDLLRQFQAQMPDRTLLNLYGSSEVSADSTAVDATAIAPTASVPIGRPIDSTSIYILDDDMQPVPIGIAGEIYLGGAGLARGYLFRPGLTAERFIPDPYSSKPGARLYRTRDIGRYKSDGNVEYIGRMDRQVKLRGIRIDLGEIESVLGCHPVIRDVAVALHSAAQGGDRVVAYVVPHQAPAPSPDQLRQFLGHQLPPYMIPAIFMILEELPLTPNGKIDRRRLPAPPSARDALEETYTPPRTQVEEMLTHIWAQVLGLDRVGVDDNFFSIGGHSLLATQVMARLRSSLSVDLPLRALFEAPSIAQLARHVELARGTVSYMLPPIEPISRQLPLAPSFAQQRLWFLDQLAPADPSYNVPGAIRIRGPLDVMALERSLQQIVARHEVLRTTFTAVDGDPLQVVALSTNFNLNLIDLQSLEETNREAEAQRLAEAEAGRPFSLTQGPLLRASLLVLGDQNHILLLTMHHIISDGWSLGVLMREASALYHSFSTGQPSALPDLPIQYADFAHWQRQWLAGELLNAQLDFWSHQLGAAPPALAFPTDLARPTNQTHIGAHFPVLLDPNLVAQLHALSRKHQATMYMTLLAAFKVLLYRYTRQDDISVGSPIAGRIRTETEALIGFFVNTLVMRTDLSGAPSFAHLLSRVKEVTLGAYSNQDVPFEKLVEVLSPRRDLNRTPFFQVMFILQNAPLPQMQLGEAKLEPFNVSSGTSKFDLTMSLEEKAGSIEGYLEYSTELLEEQTIQRMIGHFKLLIEAIVDNDQEVIDRLPLLTSIERFQLIQQWNDTRAEYPSLCIHELFQQRVDISPEAVAVVAGPLCLTYRELDLQANQMAQHLRSLGVGPETIVGMYLERSADVIVCMLGILKAGGTYLPLDLAAPQERITFMLNDARACVLLTDSALQDRLPQSQARVVYLDGDKQAIANLPQTAPGSDVRGQQVAYIMYTSGSTGRPKGVCIPHQAVVRLALASSYIEITADDTVSHLAPVSFDAVTFEIWAALLNGACVAIADGGTLSLEELGRFIQQHRITTSWLTAPLFHQMAENHLDDMTGLRNLLAGGDVLSPRHVRRVRQAMPECRMINGYGPTENTTFTCCGVINELLEGAAAPIGRPIDNTQVYLLDGNLQPVPIGVAGELYTGGDGLAQGYLGSPELTAEKFIPNPFGDSGTRLYRTGDMARYLPDGNIVFLGRLDFQVKIRGFRIELGEIQFALELLPAVSQSVVIAHQDSSGDKRLVAYLQTCQPISIAEIRDALRQRLPDYMVPSIFMILEQMPLTPNGKIDRQRLPAPPSARNALEETYTPPRNQVEKTLAQIWAEVLDLDRVGVDDNFFSIGGHSLLATRAMSRIHSSFQIDLPLRRLFELPTIAELAEAIDAAISAQSQPRLPDIVPLARKIIAVPLDFDSLE